MPQHITVVDYDPDWPRQFQAEAARIRAVLGDNCTAIYHIGSTAVPGLAAKPILDIMPVVENLEAVDRAAPAFEAMGYEYLGEFGIPGRRYLRKGGDERTHQLHIFARTDRANITRHLAVRDYLRAHREAREEYARLKRALARQFPYDIDGYCLGKEEFVQALEQAALEESINFKEGSAMRRADREVTDRNQLEEILKACHAVHIGAQDGDGMFVVPMNYGSCTSTPPRRGGRWPPSGPGGPWPLRWTADMPCARRTPPAATATPIRASWARAPSRS